MRTDLKQLLKHAIAHAPIYIGILLIIVNALIDSGTIVIAPNVLAFVNVVLGALGLGVLHVRQQQAIK